MTEKELKAIENRCSNIDFMLIESLKKDINRLIQQARKTNMYKLAYETSDEIARDLLGRVDKLKNELNDIENAVRNKAEGVIQNEVK